MKALQLTSVAYDRCRTATGSISLPEEADGNASYALRLQAEGDLAAARLQLFDQLDAPYSGNRKIVALLHYGCASRNPTWVLVVCANNIGINGLTPLPATVLQPGDLLAIDHRCWLISSLWQPEPVEAPAELRDKPCPICGGKLGQTPVVQCGCGRWTHLENAASPNDEDALNCFTKAGTCGECGRRASLEPQIFPEVSSQFTSQAVDGAEFAW